MKAKPLIFSGLLISQAFFLILVFCPIFVNTREHAKNTVNATQEPNSFILSEAYQASAERHERLAEETHKILLALNFLNGAALLVCLIWMLGKGKTIGQHPSISAIV